MIDHAKHARVHSRAVAPSPIDSAKACHLRYVSDTQPGIRRIRSGKGFCYRGPNGKCLRDRAELQRIRRLVVPPAWTEVWICADANGHVQATGRDARGRKQYRYHPKYRALREETKYERMIAFAHAL